MSIQAQHFPALWVSHVNNHNVAAAIGLYSEGFTLTPTFSSQVVNTHKQLHDYFTALGEKENLSVELFEDSIAVQTIKNQAYVVTGKYAFNFNVDGSALSFPSHFSFVIDLDKEKPILHHHSSQLPGQVF